jgi:large subunit ribosomal protein L10
MTKQKAHVSDEKKKIVGDLTELIKNKKTILIASIKDIPASQFQKISKKLRGKAMVKVIKKNLIFRALDDSGNEVAKKLKEKIIGDVAILFSDINSFELAAELIQNKSPVKAKPGQEAPEDIEIPAGPTDLMPGPAISELGALGIQVQIDKGKITIREAKIITKQGEKISAGAADVMNKLDIKPFSIGFIPLAAFDAQDNKLYTDINIDKEKTIEELKTAFGKALPFAVEIGYVCKDTISFLLQKAGSHEKALEKFGGEEKAPKGVPSEEGKEETEEQVSEEKVEEEKTEITEEENKDDIKEETQERPKTEDENVQPENKNQEEEK